MVLDLIVGEFLVVVFLGSIVELVASFLLGGRDLLGVAVHVHWRRLPVLFDVHYHLLFVDNM